MNYLNTLEKKVSYRISRMKCEVFVCGDFSDLGGYDQVGRALRFLVKKNKLIKIGYGLYAKATKSPLSGKDIPRVGITELASQALKKLGVEKRSSSFEESYNAGRTTQVPTGRVVGVKSRISRRIGYDGKFVTFERV